MNGGLLLTALSAKLGGLEAPRLAVTAIKVSTASIVMAAVSFAAARTFGGDSATGQLIAVAAGVFLGIATLVLVSRALGLRELNDALAVVTRRLRPDQEDAAS
jgi:peptidoglycan biosynthesis protein MviN/MurJ (putative lipid II flippase)